MIENEGYLVDVLLCNEIWFGVTYKEDKPWVEVNLSNMKKKGLYPDYLWG